VGKGYLPGLVFTLTSAPSRSKAHNHDQVPASSSSSGVHVQCYNKD